MKAFLESAGKVLGAFFTHIWKFFFDLFTDKQGNYDEKRVIGFALILLGVLAGLNVLPIKVDAAFAYFLVSTGIGLYFGAGAMDGIGVPQQAAPPLATATTGLSFPTGPTGLHPFAQGPVTNQSGASNGIGER